MAAPTGAMARNAASAPSSEAGLVCELRSMLGPDTDRAKLLTGVVARQLTSSYGPAAARLVTDHVSALIDSDPSLRAHFEHALAAARQAPTA